MKTDDLDFGFRLVLFQCRYLYFDARLTGMKLENAKAEAIGRDPVFDTPDLIKIQHSLASVHDSIVEIIELRRAYWDKIEETAETKK